MSLKGRHRDSSQLSPYILEAHLVSNNSALCAIEQRDLSATASIVEQNLWIVRQVIGLLLHT